jgi:uncharacterized membrane protein
VKYWMSMGKSEDIISPGHGPPDGLRVKYKNSVKIQVPFRKVNYHDYSIYAILGEFVAPTRMIFSHKLKSGKVSLQTILLILAALFIAYFTFVSFSRHDNFYSRRLDLGNMDQTVWNVLHGNGFTLTDPMGERQESRLAVHADFLLILLAPFYLIWSNPKMLLIIQAFIAGLGAFPVYWIAKDRLKSNKLALMLAVAYLLYPPLERKMLHDFHAVALSTTFLLFSYWYMHTKKYIAFIIFGILAALGKEHVWITIGLMGMYIAFIQKKYLLGILTAVLSFSVFYYLFWVAIPAVTPAGQHFALVYLSEFGDKQNSILKNILVNPLMDLRLLTQPDRLYYYFQLLVPFGFLSLASPLYLIFSAPSLLINALSNNSLMRQIDYQYDSVITPFIFISAIEGYIVIRSRMERWYKGKHPTARVLLNIWVWVAVLSSVYMWGELPLGKSTRFFFFTSSQYEKTAMKRVEQLVDSKATVSVTNNIGSHFSQREFLYNFPIGAETADFSVAHLGDPYAWPSGDAQSEAVRNLLKNDNYELIAQEGTFFAFKKKGI